MEAVPRIVGGPAATAGHGRCRGLLHARRTTPQALRDAVSLARRGRPRCLRHGASTRSADGPSRPGDGPDEVHPVDDRWLRWRADVGRRAHAPAVAVRAPTAPSEPRWTTPLSAPPPDRPRDNRLSAPRVARHMITVTYEDRRVATGVPVCRRPEQGRVTELGAGLASGLNTRRSGRSPLSVGLRRRARRSKPRPTARRSPMPMPFARGPRRVRGRRRRAVEGRLDPARAGDPRRNAARHSAFFSVMRPAWSSRRVRNVVVLCAGRANH
jgi:hypothetical protein